MIIEQNSETQIQAVVNHTDLHNRDIEIKDLLCGSEKAQVLIKEILTKANKDFCFETENIPLMIEAVPLSKNSISLVITKIEDT